MRAGRASLTVVFTTDNDFVRYATASESEDSLRNPHAGTIKPSAEFSCHWVVVELASNKLQCGDSP